MKKVLIAPSAYKGSFSPAQVAGAIADGLKDCGRSFEIMMAPLADGGDGTIEALHMACGGRLIELVVAGALGGKRRCHWLKLPDLAVVELASACGIAALGKTPLSPLSAHTEGLGQVLRDCFFAGEKQVVVAVGGSASTDGGTGALHALGARFLDKDGNELPAGGGALAGLAACDLSALDRWRSQVSVRVATDVRNPLLGSGGAASIYGPQKGATPAQCAELDSALAKLADVLEDSTGKKVRGVPGSGAAGGAAFGLACALEAEIISGFQWIACVLRLPELIGECDLVVTGEGRLDSQSLMGKSAGQLAEICLAAGRPLWVITGTAEKGVNWHKLGIENVVEVCKDNSAAKLDQIRWKAAQAFKQIL